MDKSNLAAKVPANQYRLPEAARQAILAETDLARQRAKIETLRVAFKQRHGCEFGQEIATR